MNKERGITFEMTVEFIIAVLLAVLFFLPGLGFLDKTVSAAGIFPMMREMMQSTQYAWCAYTFLLLYVIPLFALICAICFLSQSRRILRSNFGSLCYTALALLIILVLTGAYSATGFEDYGQSLLDTISGMGTAFWAMFALSVLGLIFVGIARSLRRPVIKAAGSGVPPPKTPGE